MKYPQLVHIPGDVEHWLAKQLETRGVSGIICAKYFLSLLVQINAAIPMECLSCVGNANVKNGKEKCYQVHCGRQSWDVNSLRHLGVPCSMSTLNQKCDIEKLVDELCVQLKEIQNNGSSLFDITTTTTTTTASDTVVSLANIPVIYSDPPPSGNLNSSRESGPFSSHYPIWTRGLLHDSESIKDQDKMDDYFSSLFCESQSDNFGLDFIRIKSNERQDGKERDRVNFYNRQNLASSDSTERLYERNTDVDKLIAKFDANIEGIWKPSCEPEELTVGYENILSENFLGNPCLQNGPNLIWSFGQNENDSVNMDKLEKSDGESFTNYRPDFSTWSKYSSPSLNYSSNYGINAMLNSVNLALSNVQKWSSFDGQNDECNLFLNHKRKESGFTEVTPRTSLFGSNASIHCLIPREKLKGNGEEEDLLTSMKTHFRPIHLEEIQAGQAVAYADGTTFAISNELEKVTFKRSNSGVLYLDADGEVETPRKYMEYKEREMNAKIFESASDLSLMEEFIPKFRVRQSNEKCCQTEDLVEDDQIVPSLNETDCESDSCECEVDEFFFPGDSELAEDIVNKMDEESKLAFRTVKSDCNYNDIYVTDNIGGNALNEISNSGQCVCSIGTTWLPSGQIDSREEWNDIWDPQNNYDCCNCNGFGLPTKDEYFRFREELTQEGEQLLSDLSSLQQLYSNSQWCDDESGTASDIIDEDGTNDIFGSTEIINKIKRDDEDVNGKGSWLGKEDTDPCENAARTGRNVREKNSSGKPNEKCERPYIIDKSTKERKRRNSSNQKICNPFEDEFHRTYKISFCDSVNMPLFFFDAGRMKDLARSLKRPLSF